MIDHESHLRKILEEQRTLSGEIQEMTNALNFKREQFMKMQGIIEYLAANGIKPEENEKLEEIEQ